MAAHDLSTLAPNSNNQVDDLREKMVNFGLAFDFMSQREVTTAFAWVDGRIRAALLVYKHRAQGPTRFQDLTLQ